MLAPFMLAPLYTCALRAASKSACALVLACFCSLACAQDVLTLSSGTSTPGGTIQLPLTYSSGASATNPAALQWTLAYPTADVTSISVSPGPAALAANKSIVCNQEPTGYTCIAAGIVNDNLIGNGVLALVQITLASTVAGSVSVPLSNVLAADANGASLAITAAAGTISINAGGQSPPVQITGLSCEPSIIVGAAFGICAVQLYAPVLANTQLSISSSSPNLVVPATLTIPKGANAGAFQILVNPPASILTATITIASSSSTVATPLTLMPSLSSSRFEIVDNSTGACMTAASGARLQTIVVEAACSGRQQQVVQVAAVTAGYDIRFDSGFLDSGTSGSPQLVLQFNGTSSTWAMIPISQSGFVLLSEQSLQCLTGAGGQQAIRESSCTLQPDQVWKFVPVVAPQL
ncbi:MAG: hypothetical protein JO061_02390 [Acidobacteriaceae bacterium]|nr:hypothetical protein [Acidobacteriaceae bacterium]